jgi:hypothetical protein
LKRGNAGEGGLLAMKVLLILQAFLVFSVPQVHGGEIFDKIADRKGLEYSLAEKKKIEKAVDHKIELLKKLDVRSVGIERSACLGTCPSYCFVANSDGSFRYNGFDHVEHKGFYKGKVKIGIFSLICALSFKDQIF